MMVARICNWTKKTWLNDGLQGFVLDSNRTWLDDDLQGFVLGLKQKVPQLWGVQICTGIQTLETN